MKTQAQKTTKKLDGPAICLVSGGMDSCVSAAIAIGRHKETAFLHVNYGQRTEKTELEAFRRISAHYGITKQLIADISYLAEIGGSALTDSRIAVPTAGIENNLIPNTYVPFRNTHLIAIAVSWAEVIGANYIYIGATEVDSSGYPDCRAAYFEAFNQLIKTGTRPESHIEIVTPLLHMTKREVVLTGMQVQAPLHLTWSCYKNEKLACGHCDSCRLRLKGFQEAGVKDPIPYE
ncbi:MAG: 7-cyano-7-deazaguanine synthase QueC [Dissulfuribacterales bacterium]